MNYFIYIVCGIVTASVVAGFLTVGSPQKARLARFDEVRIGHLQQIQYEVINYWQSKGILPYNLDDLVDATRGVTVPVDPQSDESYLYTVTGDVSFELCAIFAREGDSEYGYPMPMRPMMYPAKGVDVKNNIWQHLSGKQCFSRTIDKDFYPPFPKAEVKK